MYKYLPLFFLTFSAHAATVLFIGDSHSVGPFGWSFDQHLRDAQHQVVTHASCGSVLKWWTSGQKTTCGYFARDIKGNKTQLTTNPTPILSKLLADVKPDVVVMEFGGNYVKTPSDDFVRNDIKAAIKKVKASGAACFWVTNPDTRNYRAEIPRITRLVKEAIGDDCPIFESYKVTRYPETGGDGIHYWSAKGTPIAKAWAKKAFEAFQTHWK